MRAKYVNPFTDFGFKKIFGEEASKPLLMDFLNALLPQEKNIVALTFKNTEQLGQYIYLEMPNFNKTEQELSTRLDKWLFFIKHLEDFQTIPQIFKDEIFSKAFEKAELAKLSPEEMDSYENSLKIYRDLKNVIDTAREEGREEGRAEGIQEGKLEVARELKRNGVPADIIAKSTGLTEDEIGKL